MAIIKYCVHFSFPFQMGFHDYVFPSLLTLLAFLLQVIDDQGVNNPFEVCCCNPFEAKSHQIDQHSKKWKNDQKGKINLSFVVCFFHVPNLIVFLMYFAYLTEIREAHCLSCVSDVIPGKVGPWIQGKYSIHKCKWVTMSKNETRKRKDT